MTTAPSGAGTTGRYYPRSFLRLLLLAFAAVALPFALAFLSAALEVERLADRSEAAMDQAVRTARASRALLEEVPGLERTARQYLVLRDKALLADYGRLRGNFRAVVDDLSGLPLDAAQAGALRLIAGREEALFERLRGARGAADRSSLIAGYAELAERTRSLQYAADSMVARSVEEVRSLASRAQDLLWWRLGAVILVGIAVCVAVTIVVARPVQQLDQAIRALGSGKFADPIRVGGPADLAYLGARLDWMRRRLMDLEHQKQVFLRHVSHELKSPLSALREGTDLLAKGTAGPLVPMQQDIVGILKQKCAELQGMIGEMLDYQRIQETAMRLELQPVRLDALAARVLEDHRLAALGRGLRTETRLEPVVVHADAQALRAVIANLVSNAIKYSPEGGTVSLSVQLDGDAARLEVGDTGPGVAREDRERIFEWFYRARPGMDARAGGSGLGLAIAKEFVSVHGGTIHLVEEDLPGARFRVAWPLLPRIPAR